MTVICERTGESFTNESIMAMIHPEGCRITYNTNPISPSYGQPSNSQQGSQFWMQSDYTSAEPNDTIKALYSDAQYAYEQIPALIASLGISNTQPINPSVQAILNAQAAQTTAAKVTSVDLSGLTNAGQSMIDFMAKNAMMIVILVAGIVLLPSLTSAFSTRGR